MNTDPARLPLKFDELLARCMGEAEFAERIVRDFIESSGSLLTEINQQLASDSREDAARTVHRLKGTAATVAARPLFESLERLEQLLQAEASLVDPQVAEWFVTSRERFDDVKQYVETCLFD